MILFHNIEYVQKHSSLDHLGVYNVYPGQYNLFMGEITRNAYAKINLTLDVLHKREDGYHALYGIMRQIDLYDVVRVRAAADVRVTSDVPLPADNTLYRAARSYMELCGGGAHISVQKHIPSESGLGGASADAAAVLRALQGIYGAASEAQLYELGARIGADVPFCLMGGCVLAEGVGERLTPLSPIRLALVLVKGAGGIRTADLFRSLKLPVEHPDTQAALRAVEQNDAKALAANVKNALTPAAVAVMPQIQGYKEQLLRLGALGAEMTGSGSAVFGIFEEAAAARAAARAFVGADFVQAVSTV